MACYASACGVHPLQQKRLCNAVVGHCRREQHLQGDYDRYQQQEAQRSTIKTLEQKLPWMVRASSPMGLFERHIGRQCVPVQAPAELCPCYLLQNTEQQIQLLPFAPRGCHIRNTKKGTTSTRTQRWWSHRQRRRWRRRGYALVQPRHHLDSRPILLIRAGVLCCSWQNHVWVDHPDTPTSLTDTLVTWLGCLLPAVGSAFLLL